eukprot:g6412.t1
MPRRYEYRPGKHAVGLGFVDLALLSVVGVGGVHCMTIAAAFRLPWIFVPPVAMLLWVLFVNFIYLSIYELGRHWRIDDGRCDKLIDTVHGWCLVHNYFAPDPPATRPWPERILAVVARIFAQFFCQ